MAMVKVNLSRFWFAPNGSRYSPSDNPHSFPKEWEELLPTTAKVVKAAEAPKEEAPKKVEAKKAEAK